MNPSFRLIMQTGPTPGREIPLQKSEMFIGRDLNNDIVINDAEVSRRHARLSLQGTSYLLEDLGSTNGSFINGTRLVSPTLIRPGEIITFGERINLVLESLTFSQAATPAAQPVAPVVVPVVQPEPVSPAPVVVAEPQPVISQPSMRSAQSRPEPSPMFSGQVPASTTSPAPIIKTRIPTWIWIVLAIETLLLIFLIIDDARLWCPLFGLALNAIFPGACQVGP